MKRQPRVLVVGSINMDLILRTGRVPSRGETILGKDYQLVPGGKGANQAVAASRLGGQVTFVGRIGNDANGERLMAQFEREGICTDYIKVDETSNTGLAAIMLEDSGDNRIIVYSGANMNISMEDVESALEQDYDVVLLQLEIPDDIVMGTFKLAKEKGISVVLDTAPARPLPLENFKGIDIISPNETEATALTGIEINSFQSAVQAAKVLQAMCDPKHVVIKMGSKGAMVFDCCSFRHVPSFDVEAVDTTAAGDAFTAAMATEYIKGGEIERAVEFANAVGALTVTKLGAQPSIPTRKEVDNFIDIKNK